MVFSELYSAYYNAIADILAQIIDGERNEKELQKAVVDRAFVESILTIMLNNLRITILKCNIKLQYRNLILQKCDLFC